MLSSVDSWIKKYGFFVLLFLAVALLLSPSAFRSLSLWSPLFGGESYYSFRLAELSSDTGLLFGNDPLSFGGRPYVGELGWPYILSFFPELLSQFLPFILGLFSFLLFYFLIKKLLPTLAEYATFFFVVSPVFIYLFTVSTPHAFAFFLLLAGLHLALLHQNLLAVLIFFLISFFSFYVSLFVFFVYLFYFLFKKHHAWYSILFFFLLLSSFYLQFYAFLSFDLSFPFSFVHGEFFNYFFSHTFANFGSSLGLGFFAFLLSLIGFYSLWKKKFLYLFAYAVLFVLFVLHYYIESLLFYLSAVLSVFAAYGFVYLLQKKWASLSLQHITLFVIFCGLIFTPLSYVNELVRSDPSPSYEQAMLFLQSKDSSVVFSHFSRGDFISSSGHATVTDSHFLFAPSALQRFQDSNFLFMTGNLTRSSSLFDFYNVSYIWIDEDLREELYNGQTTALLSLLQNYPQIFIKVFDNAEVEIWFYVRENDI